MLETIASHLDTITSFAPVWGLVFVFVFMAVESSFIPFPSEVVMIPAGFLAARGELGIQDPFLAASAAVACGIAGSLAGAYINYALALWLGRPFLERHGKWFFLKPETLSRACEIFNKYGSVSTFVCRMIPAIRQLISIPAGIARMPLVPFTVFTALGAGIWTSILAWAGFAISRSQGNISYLELCIKGKETVSANLPAIIAVAVALAGAHVLVSKMVLGKRKQGEGK